MYIKRELAEIQEELLYHKFVTKYPSIENQKTEQVIYIDTDQSDTCSELSMTSLCGDKEYGNDYQEI